MQQLRFYSPQWLTLVYSKHVE